MQECQLDCLRVKAERKREFKLNSDFKNKLTGIKLFHGVRESLRAHKRFTLVNTLHFHQLMCTPKPSCSYQQSPVNPYTLSSILINFFHSLYVVVISNFPTYQPQFKRLFFSSHALSSNLSRSRQCQFLYSLINSHGFS